MPWILIIQIWTADEPGQIHLVYRKEYPNYVACMEARKEWTEKKFVALCGVKVETNKDASKNLEEPVKKTTR